MLNGPFVAQSVQAVIAYKMNLPQGLLTRCAGAASRGRRRWRRKVAFCLTPRSVLSIFLLVVLLCMKSLWMTDEIDRSNQVLDFNTPEAPLGVFMMVMIQDVSPANGGTLLVPRSVPTSCWPLMGIAYREYLMF